MLELYATTRSTDVIGTTWPVNLTWLQDSLVMTLTG
jgi:hypothetical protein